MGKLLKTLLICILLLACCLQVSAATGVITVFAPAGSELRLYRVGSMTHEKVLPQGAFASSGVQISHVHSPEAARLLADFAREKNLQGVVKSADESGTVCFDELDEGVYLVVHAKSADGFSPFLFSIPESDIYALEARPKLAPTSTHPQVSIPQTGDRVQPLLLSAVAAVLFSGLGLLLCLSKYKNRRS